MDELQAALRAGPKFMYVLPNFHDPASVTLALDRRQQLVELADRYGVPLIEDDPYGQLRYDGEHLPPLAVLDGQLWAHEGGALQWQCPVPQYLFEDVGAWLALGLDRGAR
jgi:2-aminoadipate transaminase